MKVLEVVGALGFEEFGSWLGVDFLFLDGERSSVTIRRSAMVYHGKGEDRATCVVLLGCVFSFLWR